MDERSRWILAAWQNKIINNSRSFGPKMWDTEEDRPIFTWEINREATLYFDRLWASEIGIKL